jgi:Flp pilus assembly protein CpaB
MNKNLVSLFAVAFVVALMATGIFYGLFIGNVKQSGPPPSANLIVVANKNLDRGTTLAAGDVKTVEAPAGQVVAGAITDPAKVQGLTVVEPVRENDPILQTLLSGGNSSGGSAVPKGMRVTNIHVGDSGGVIAMLRGGQRVDVQVVTTLQETRLRTLLQNVEVLNVPAPENGRHVVNLVVTPEEADLLGLADSIGRIRLVLRNPKDTANSNLQSVTAAAILHNPAPSAKPQATAASTKEAPAVALRATAAK